MYHVIILLVLNINYTSLCSSYMFYYFLGCTLSISYLRATLYIHALMLNDIKKLHTWNRKKKKKISIIGTLGSGWNWIFYMGTQNGSNHELWSSDFFDSHLRIKITPLRVFPICLYREAMHLQWFHVWCALFRNMLIIGVWATCLHCMALLHI